MNAPKPAICIPLQLQHIRERLQWNHDHVDGTLQDWTPVLFSDESRFCVDFTDSRARVWGRRNERFAPVLLLSMTAIAMAYLRFRQALVSRKRQTYKSLKMARSHLRGT